MNVYFRLIITSIALFVVAFQIGDILKELIKSLVKNRASDCAVSHDTGETVIIHKIEITQGDGSKPLKKALGLILKRRFSSNVLAMKNQSESRSSRWRKSA